MASGNSIIDEFTRLINQCEGKVIFVTDEGDRLVVNSMLSALVGFSTILSVAEAMPLRLECDNPQDCQMIVEFMKKYNLGQFRIIDPEG